MKKILIVEDDKDLSRGLAYALAQDGYRPRCAFTLAQAEAILREAPDLLLLDVRLPDGSGVDFCRQCRRHSALPIIMLTACDMETDEVCGLLAGADDYITKPFSLAVLRVRMEALLRRQLWDGGAALRSGPLRLDTAACRLFRGEEEIVLSATEYRLLSYLMRNDRRVLTKEQILSALWDSEGSYIDENTVAVNISRLRAKLEEDPKHPRWLKTVHGLGYVWQGGDGP